jgi:hypothetical protein
MRHDSTSGAIGIRRRHMKHLFRRLDSPRRPELMYRESNAVLNTMLELLRDHRVPSLPAHESLIVPVSHQSLAEDILKRNFLTACHIEPSLEVHPPQPQISLG